MACRSASLMSRLSTIMIVRRCTSSAAAAEPQHLADLRVLEDEPGVDLVVLLVERAAGDEDADGHERQCTIKAYVPFNRFRAVGPARPPDPRPRRRDGHDGAAARPDGGRLPRRAVRRPPARPQGRQRRPRADAARRHRARSTTSTSPPAPTSSRPTRSTRTAIAQADYGLEAVVHEMNVAAARLARAGGRRVDGPHAGPPAVRRRLDRPDQQDAVDLARRQRPVVPRRHLRPGARRPTPSRCAA